MTCRNNPQEKVQQFFDKMTYLASVITSTTRLDVATFNADRDVDFTSSSQEAEKSVAPLPPSPFYFITTQYHRFVESTWYLTLIINLIIVASYNLTIEYVKTQ